MTALTKFNGPRVGERGRSPRGGVSCAFRPRFAAAIAAALALSACAATQTSAAVSPGAPGFLLGLWHGFIFPVAWVVSLFVNNVAVYAVPNAPTDDVAGPPVYDPPPAEDEVEETPTE